jgi:glyoxylase-like metal-dependent hydrolase (beta-lactamase superfamily II)
MEGIPLTGNPLKELNCFIIKGSRRNLVVDLGFDIPEGKLKVQNALRELDCRPEVTDLFITHAHEDHIGAMVSLRREGCFYNTYISEQEAWFYNHLRVCGLEQHIRQMAKLEGFSDREGEEAFLWHPASHNKGSKEPVEFVTVREGDVIDLGDFRFRVCMFPGHTMGLAALYEEERKLLFAGDHILGRISPNIAFWQMDFDALGEYIHSLHKADALDVDHLFSAHRYLVEDMHARIRELLEHHRRRLDEVVTILKEESEPRNVRQVAENMHWDYGGGDFNNFAMTQQWFATGEAFAHLEHLYWKKKICREERDGALLYFVK